MSRDAVLIGGCSNSLVAAIALSRAGWRVQVLDPGRDEGMVGELSGWVPSRIVRELGLARFGWRANDPDPWLTVPLPDGGALELRRDVAATAEAIRKVCQADGARWPDFCVRMSRMAAVLERLYLAPPPDPVSHALSDQWRLGLAALHARRLGRQAVTDLLRTLPMSVCDLLDDWFVCEPLKAALGAIAVRGVGLGPRAAGTAFVLLHHHVGCPPGVFSASSGNLREALLSCADGHGVRISVGADVSRIQVEAGRVTGVTLESGEGMRSSLVLSSADPRRTFLGLLDATWLPPEFVRAVTNIRIQGVRAVIRLVLGGPPGFQRFVVAPTLDHIERASDDAKYGRASADPVLEAEALGTRDGHHHVLVHAQYAPCRLRDGSWNAEQRGAFGDLVVERLARLAPALRDAAMERTVYLPVDLEKEFRLTGGHLYHGEMALDQFLFMRPVAGWARYRTPVRGLYLCGAGAHPGGGIPGVPGFNCVRTVLREQRDLAR